MVRSSSFTVIWDRKVLDNFKEILTYLSKQNNQAPKMVKDSIVTRLETIKTNPLICELDKLKDHPNKNYRAFVVYSYRVTYQIKIESKEIRVLRIRHTSREPFGY